MASGNLAKPMAARIQHDMYTKVLQGQSLTTFFTSICSEEIKSYAQVLALEPPPQFESFAPPAPTPAPATSPEVTSPTLADKNNSLKQEIDELKQHFQEEHSRSVEQQDFIDQLLTENQTQAHHLKRIQHQNLKGPSTIDQITSVPIPIANENVTPNRGQRDSKKLTAEEIEEMWRSAAAEARSELQVEDDKQPIFPTYTNGALDLVDFDLTASGVSRAASLPPPTSTSRTLTQPAPPPAPATTALKGEVALVGTVLGKIHRFLNENSYKMIDLFREHQDKTHSNQKRKQRRESRSAFLHTGGPERTSHLSLTMPELAKLFKRVGLQLSKDEQRQVMQCLDLKGDGELDVTELDTLLQSIRFSQKHSIHNSTKKKRRERSKTPKARRPWGSAMPKPKPGKKSDKSRAASVSPARHKSSTSSNTSTKTPRQQRAKTITASTSAERRIPAGKTHRTPEFSDSGLKHSQDDSRLASSLSSLRQSYLLRQQSALGGD